MLHSSCPVALPILSISHYPKQNEAYCGITRIKVKPTKDQNLLCHPVLSMYIIFILRLSLGVWIVYCFIMGVAFGANLRAFLVMPVYTKRIENLQDVVDSGFSVGLCHRCYGEEGSVKKT